MKPPPITSTRLGLSASQRLQAAPRRRSCGPRRHRPAPPRRRPATGGCGPPWRPPAGRSRRCARRPGAPAAPPGRDPSPPRPATTRHHRGRGVGAGPSPVAGARPSSTCFDNGGRSYGLLLLVADDGDRSVVAAGAQRLGRPQPGQRRPDDHDPGTVGQPADLRPGHGDAARSSTSTRMAPTGHAAAARNTLTRWASSGSGTYISASCPTKRNTSGARNAHWA